MLALQGQAYHNGFGPGFGQHFAVGKLIAIHRCIGRGVEVAVYHCSARTGIVTKHHGLVSAAIAISVYQFNGAVAVFELFEPHKHGARNGVYGSVAGLSEIIGEDKG